jgi:predicted transcriptional regulator
VPPSTRSRRARNTRRSFRSVGDLLQILTESIAGFAANLDRDYSAVHDDVSLLADYGLLFVIEDGHSRRPYLPDSGSISRSNSSAGIPARAAAA